MTHVGTVEAKANLTRLLKQVANGERVVITARGKPVAMLVPPEEDRSEDIRRTVERMLRWRDEHGPTLGPDLTLRQLREEGQRG